MIRTDGNRSLQRMWFAKKKLAQIIEMDIPAKAAILDGFLIKVNQQDDITGGFIMAPMGLRVYCSKDTGVFCCNADFWGGIIKPGVPLALIDANLGDYARVMTLNEYAVPSVLKQSGDYIKNRLYQDAETGEKFYADSATEMTGPAYEYSISRIDPYVYGLPGSPDWTTAIFFTSSPLTYYWSATNCRPVSFPLYDSEGGVLTVSVRNLRNKEAELPKTYEMQIQGYQGNGSALTRRGWSHEQEKNNIASNVTFNLPSHIVRSVLTFQGPLLNKIPNSFDISLATVFEGNWDIWDLLSEEEQKAQKLMDSRLRWVPSSAVFANILPELLSEMQMSSISYSSVVGSYAYSLDKAEGMTLLTAMFTIPGTSCDIVEGENRKWRVYYTLYQDGPDLQNPELGRTVSTVTADQILGVLDLLYLESHPGKGFTEIGYTNPVEFAAFPSIFRSVPPDYVPGDSVDLSDVKFDMHTQRSYANIFTIFGAHLAYPNSRSVSRCRSDSIMFHGPDGVYSWTRQYGIKADGTCRLIKFGTTGLEIVPCSMPQEILYTVAEKNVLDITNEIEIFKRDSRPDTPIIQLYCGAPTPSPATVSSAAANIYYKEIDLYNARRALSEIYNSDAYNNGDFTGAVDLEILCTEEIASLAMLTAMYNNLVASQVYPETPPNPYSTGTDDYELYEAAVVLVEAARTALPAYQADLLAKQEALALAKANVYAATYRAIGVRPNITYAGNDLFICVCEKVNAEVLTGSIDKAEVVNVYTGSPFTGWEPVPQFTAGKLLHIRPVSLTESGVVLLGVCEIIIPDSNVPVRHAALLDTTKTNSEWILLAQVPVKYNARDIWDITLYGNGPYVKMLQDYLSRPQTVSQYIREDYVAENTVEQSL